MSERQGCGQLDGTFDDLTMYVRLHKTESRVTNLWDVDLSNEELEVAHE